MSRWRIVPAGLAAGFFINLCEYATHAWWLDPEWTAAFAALGRTPAGWSTFIPANFWLGIIAVGGYRWATRIYGAGLGTMLRSGLVVWLVFWVIPMTALAPMALFPNTLLVWTCLVGLVDGVLGTLLGVWLYDRGLPNA